MGSPLTRVLLQTFARGFYKAHSGLLLFFFGTVLLSCFYVSVLNETHIPPDERILYALMIPLTFTTTPIFAILAFVIWLVYTIKSWQYVFGELSMIGNEFLRYSSTSMKRVSQYESWLILQLWISIPFIAFSIFAVIVGVVFGQYLIPLITLIYIVALALVSALIYVSFVNRLLDTSKVSWISRVIARWHKPLITIPIYQLFHDIPVSYIVAKSLSVFAIAMAFYNMDASTGDDNRWVSLVVLTLAVIHCIIAYQSYALETHALPFVRNFPYSKTRLFAMQLVFNVFLVFPEIVWISATFSFLESIQSIMLLISLITFYRSILYATGENMNVFIRLVFFSYMLVFIVLLFNITWVVTLVIFGTAVVLFFRNYYRS